MEIAEGTRCRVLVNDRLDVALAAGADGVHLRESSVSIVEARRVAEWARAKKFIVGRSVHDASTAARAEGADYLIVGAVFETESKTQPHSTLGLEGLRRVVASTTCPVWAIGGVTAERMPALAACGVDGIAAIGAFLPPRGVTDLEREVQRMTESLRFSLDSF
jgi:thiamine-phosphate pyrophosphorylase